VGLYDLKRRIRPVGRRYQELVRHWRARLDNESVAAAASA